MNDDRQALYDAFIENLPALLHAAGHVDLLALNTAFSATVLRFGSVSLEAGNRLIRNSFELGFYDEALAKLKPSPLGLQEDGDE